jgi:hypothetical protein
MKFLHRIVFLLFGCWLSLNATAQKVRLNHVYDNRMSLQTLTLGPPVWGGRGHYSVYYMEPMYRDSSQPTVVLRGDLRDPSFPATHPADTVMFHHSLIAPLNDEYEYNVSDSIRSWFGRSIDVRVRARADFHDSDSRLQTFTGTIRPPQPLHISNDFAKPGFDSAGKTTWAETLGVGHVLHWQPDSLHTGNVFLWVSYDPDQGRNPKGHVRRWSMLVPDNGSLLLPVELLGKIPAKALFLLAIGRSSRIELQNEKGRRSQVFIHAINYQYGNFLKQ